MEFRLKKHIAFNVRQYEGAVRFYRDVLGWQLIKEGYNQAHFKKDDTNFYPAENEKEAGVFYFEYEVNNIKEARETLLNAGCSIQTIYSETSMMFTDPFGSNFHVYQKGTILPDL